MAIPARLSRKLRESLGDEGANDLVDWMVLVEDRRSELQGIVDASRAAADARFAEFNARIDQRFAEIDLRFSEIDLRFSETNRRMDAGFAEHREGLAKLETVFERRFGDLMKWSFVFWCGAVGAVAMLARALTAD
jgi:hypothetical protein